MLLRQLQQRRKPLSASPSPERAALLSLLPAVPCGDGASTRILVCGGVDCVGLGSGAALLEIEELCAELGSAVDVGTGACSLQCANAPVINVQHRRSRCGSSPHVTHWAKVDGPQRCAEVVADATSTPCPVVRGPMLRRADGLRWAALRQQARSRMREQHGASRQLSLALQAEQRAAAGDPAVRARAERRAMRLT